MYNPLTTSSDGVNLLDDIEGEVPTTTIPQYEPPDETEQSDMPTEDNEDMNENLEEEQVAVDEDDEEALDVLTTWLVEMADILPSLARRFGAMFINDGVGSIRRLAKRVEREREYMETVGVPMDDAEEIYGALQREGMFVLYTYDNFLSTLLPVIYLLLRCFQVCLRKWKCAGDLPRKQQPICNPSQHVKLFLSYIIPRLLVKRVAAVVPAPTR